MCNTKDELKASITAAFFSLTKESTLNKEGTGKATRDSNITGRQWINRMAMSLNKSNLSYCKIFSSNFLNVNDKVRRRCYFNFYII